MYTHCCNLLGEAGKQNNVFLLKREQVKLCVKVKGGEAQIAEVNYCIYVVLHATVYML